MTLVQELIKLDIKPLDYKSKSPKKKVVPIVTSQALKKSVDETLNKIE